MLPIFMRYNNTNYAINVNGMHERLAKLLQEFCNGNFLVKRAAINFHEVVPHQSKKWLNRTEKRQVALFAAPTHPRPWEGGSYLTTWDHTSHMKPGKCTIMAWKKHQYNISTPHKKDDRRRISRMKTTWCQHYCHPTRFPVRLVSCQTWLVQSPGLQNTETKKNFATQQIKNGQDSLTHCLKISFWHVRDWRPNFVSPCTRTKHSYFPLFVIEKTAKALEKRKFWMAHQSVLHQLADNCLCGWMNGQPRTNLLSCALASSNCFSRNELRSPHRIQNTSVLSSKSRTHWYWHQVNWWW